MQHEEREEIIDSIVDALVDDLSVETLNGILNNPLEYYSNDTILKLMGDYGVQRRTAREWLICAQVRLKIKIDQSEAVTLK